MTYHPLILVYIYAVGTIEYVVVGYAPPNGRVRAGNITYRDSLFHTA